MRLYRLLRRPFSLEGGGRKTSSMPTKKEEDVTGGRIYFCVYLDIFLTYEKKRNTSQENVRILKRPETQRVRSSISPAALVRKGKASKLFHHRCGQDRL